MTTHDYFGRKKPGISDIRIRLTGLEGVTFIKDDISLQFLVVSNVVFVSDVSEMPIVAFQAV